MNQLSIIIPVKHNDQYWKELIEWLAPKTPDVEIILVGPDFSQEKTEKNIKFIHSVQGRALQLNAGAKASTRPFLWFLHADSRLNEKTLPAIKSALSNNPGALYFFDLKFSNDGHKLMLLNEWGVQFRSRFFKMPFGDQGLLISRKNFFGLGQFSLTAPYGEDHLFVWKAIQFKIPVLPVNGWIETSARKYAANGWLKTTLKHLFLTYKQAFPEWLKTLNSDKQTAVAIFVKTPGVSTVKSRLAATIGKEKAEDFFKLSLKATESLTQEAIRKTNGRFKIYWAVAEDSELKHPMWQGYETISQGGGDLGDRLHHVYSELQKSHSSVFLIGADLPHLPESILPEALEKISAKKDYVLGETDDGGFYLFAGRKTIPKSVWKSVPYSSTETSKVLKEKLDVNNFNFLEKNFDIDNIDDLKKMAALNPESMLNEQKKAIEWAREFI